MVTVVGDTLTFVVSLLLKVTVTPPVGAAVERVTVRDADCPCPIVPLPLRLIVPGCKTWTVAVAVVTPFALTVITAFPTEPLVTSTTTLVFPWAIVAVAGTVATELLLELKLKVIPVSAAVDSNS
jgi:hypothetical protein